LKTKLNIGIIGLGSIGNKHYEYLSKFKFITLTYIQNSNLKIIDNKNTKLISSIKVNEFDAIYICTPTSTHLRFLKKLVKFSNNFVIEKPLDISISGLNKILNINTNINLYTAYVLQQKRSMKTIKKIINNNFNKILSVEIKCFSYLPNWRSNKDYLNSHTAKKKLSGGIIYELSHEINYALFLFGFPTSLISKTYTTNTIKIKDDHAIVIFNYVNKFNLKIELSISSKKEERTCSVFCNNKFIHFDLLKDKINVSSNGKSKNYNFYDDMYLNQTNEIIKSLKNNKFNKIENLKNSIDSNRILEATVISNKNNKKIIFKKKDS